MSDIKGRRIGVFASGGLTAWTVCRYLAERGAEVVAFWADVGQYDEPGIACFFDDLAASGIESVRLDLKPQVSRFALEMLSYGAHYEGRYWNSTSGLRYVLCRELGPEIARRRCRLFSHGCVGGGNDERRFINYAPRLLPGIAQYSPWSDPEFALRFRNRAAMVEYLIDDANAAYLETKAEQSTDSCLIGTSYEGTGIEDLGRDFTAVDPLMSRRPWEAEDRRRTVEIGYLNGLVTRIDGQAGSSVELLQRANEIAGGHGISLKTVFENRIQGTKCRGVYESPGMDLLYQGSSALHQLALDQNQRRRYRDLAERIGTAIYQGQYHSGACGRWRQEIRALTARLNGTVALTLYKGNVHVSSIADLDESVGASQQRRFAGGGHVWDKTEAATLQLRAG